MTKVQISQYQDLIPEKRIPPWSFQFLPQIFTLNIFHPGGLNVVNIILNSYQLISLLSTKTFFMKNTCLCIKGRFFVFVFSFLNEFLIFILCFVFGYYQLFTIGTEVLQVIISNHSSQFSLFFYKILTEHMLSEYKLWSVKDFFLNLPWSWCDCFLFY